MRSMGRRFAVAAAFAVCAPAFAQEAGDLVVMTGYLYVHPLDQSGTIETRLRPSALGAVLGIPQEFGSPGTSLSAENTDTLGLSTAYFVTDTIAVELKAGIPPVVDVRGQGVVAPPGPSGLLFNLDLGDPAINPVGTARQWSPALMLRWQPGDDGWWVRPYAGVGVTYTWFTEVRPSPGFEEALDRRFGSVLAAAAGKPGPTSADAHIGSTFAPVLEAGAALRLDEHWSVGVGMGFVTLNTKTRIDVRAQDGTRLSRTTSDVDVKAVIAGALVGYRF